MARLIDRALVRCLGRRGTTHTLLDRVINKLSYIRNNQDLINRDINGEYWLLKKVVEGNLDGTYVDVGANTGKYSAFIKRLSPSANIFMSEIDPCNLEILAKRFGSGSGFYILPYGLSNADGFLVASTYPGHSQITSLHALPWQSECISRRVEVRRASRELNLIMGRCGDIRLLKIDIEGHEMAVLSELADLHHRVDVIQFEYNKNWIIARRYLHDAYDILGETYFIGKLYPRGVDLRGYDVFRDESFQSSNYVAVHRSLKALANEIAL